MKIPLVDLSWQHREIADDVEAGWRSVLDRTAFVLGEEVSEFEREFAEFSHASYCVAVGNGTDALEFALRACAIGPGDEVIVPANTFVATALAVVRAGATPVIADVDPDCLLISPASVEEHLSDRTRAIMPVHLFGQMAPMDELETLARRHDLVLIEDAAQSHGASRNDRAAGSWGRAAGVSFYPGKNLGAYGDGGAVLTSDPDLADTLRSLRNWGGTRKYIHDELGFNSRLDTLQAVVLRAKLARLEEWNRLRQEAARRYDTLLAGLPVTGVATLAGNTHVWHLYVIRVDRRDRVLGALQEAGIGVGIHYPVPLHMHGATRYLGYRSGDFPIAERAAEEILSLPIFPGITPAQQEWVVATLGKILT